MPTPIDPRFSHEQIRDFQDGELIFAEGDTERDLYLIQEGGVLIRKKTAVGEIDLVQFERGDFFGEMALLQGIPRYASAYARGPTRLLILQPGGFLLKIRRDPTLAFEMLQQLSLRVKLTSERFIEAVSNGKLPHEVAEKILQSAENTASSRTS